MSETVEQQTTEVTPTFNPFDDSSWSDTPQNIEELKKEDSAAPTVDVVKEEEVNKENSIDYTSFVKETFGYDSVESAKEEFKKLKETTQKEELKFANEDSEKLYKAWVEGKQDEVYNYLSSQKRIDKLLNSDVNENSAEEIIKLSIQNKNKDLSDDEVDFVFNKKFSIPSKPVQSYDLTDEDYSSMLNEWENKVSAIKKELIIEAKMAKPEIEKLKSELTLPNIQQSQGIDQPTQEELQEVEQYRKDYETALETNYKTFGGFNVMFKDGDIEFPITYTPTEEEKVSLKTTLKDFDTNDYFGKRWFAEDGNPKIHDIMADKYFLENKDKILQKVANEAANQMRLQMMEKKSNIDLKGSVSQKAFNPQQKSEMESLAAWAFAQ